MILHTDYYLILPSLDIIAKEVAKKLDIPTQLVLDTYKAFWGYIKSNIVNLPLKEDLSEEDFNSLQRNFNLPYLGKFYCNYDSWLKAKNHLNYKNNDRHKYKED